MGEGEGLVTRVVGGAGRTAGDLVSLFIGAALFIPNCYISFWSFLFSLFTNQVSVTVSKTHQTAAAVVTRTLESEGTAAVITKTRETIHNLVAGLLTTSLVLSLAIFLYATFYHAYMPVEVHEAELELGFQPCDTQPAACSFPTASLNLEADKKQLMAGQAYSISMLLEVPDSPVNQGLGMFLSCLNVNSSQGSVTKVCRSNILEYRSELLRTIETLVLSPFLLTGLTTQRQWGGWTVRVNFFSEYFDDSSFPATELLVEIQSKFIQVYSAKMEIHAQLSGLRHIMYHHPWISTVMGVCANILTLTVIVLLSWTRFTAPDLDPNIFQQEKMEKEEKEKEEGITLVAEKKEKVDTVGSWK